MLIALNIEAQYERVDGPAPRVADTQTQKPQT
jgi:hypothetical protein